jgi:hypothetical protein
VHGTVQFDCAKQPIFLAGGKNVEFPPLRAETARGIATTIKAGLKELSGSNK